MRPLVELTDKFRATLAEAQKSRPEKRGRTAEDELEWVQYEREVMWHLVNEVRAKNGAAPVPIEEVKRVENFAVGHIDYSQKFALYCAELALN